ncbi:hypothetical protein JCM7447_05800 [Corynebacterium amycolatum]
MPDATGPMKLPLRSMRALTLWLILVVMLATMSMLVRPLALQPQVARSLAHSHDR